MAGGRIGLGLLARSGALLPPMQGGVEDLLLPLYQVGCVEDWRALFFIIDVLLLVCVWWAL
jgi:hypothetical protein